VPDPSQKSPASLRAATRWLWPEVLAAFAVVTAAVSVLYRLRGIGFVDRNLAVIAAVLFLYVPATLLWRRKLDLDQYGLRLSPVGQSLLLYALSAVVVFPLFSASYFFFMRHVCPHLPRVLMWCPPHINPTLRWPPQPLMVVLSQLLVVALPEEFFFRGYLQTRLSERLTFPVAWLLTGVLFALGHFLVTFDPASLAVFFPGLLFGLLQRRTGSVLAGTLFHASCNVLIDVLHRSAI
jgi:uncharacterized protein